MKRIAIGPVMNGPARLVVKKRRSGLIGFGEAGYAVETAGGWTSSAHVFDVKTDAARDRAIMLARYAEAGVSGRESLRDAVEGSELTLSLVTADQALAVAAAAAGCMTPGAVYCDMNSVAPHTKQAAPSAIEAAGGPSVD